MSEKKILIVDDDRDLVRVLRARLKASGYSVSSAPDAILAVTVARDEEPDLVILDIGLPGGDGFLVMERLRELVRADAPIIIYTGRDPSIKERALNGGAVAFLQKPADNEELLSVIRKTLGESNQQPMQEKI